MSTSSVYPGAEIPRPSLIQNASYTLFPSLYQLTGLRKHSDSVPLAVFERRTRSDKPLRYSEEMVVVSYLVLHSLKRHSGDSVVGRERLSNSTSFWLVRQPGGQALLSVYVRCSR